MTPQSHYVDCLGHELHYTEWGAPDGTPLLAWHGLARTGRDMDDLAQHLAPHGWRVICPDAPGRGLSEWSQRPRDEYRLDHYARVARALMDALDVQRAHWLGTSMGGAIGMVCAAGRVVPALRGRIASLVLNDSAPQLAESALDRIRAYAGSPPVFDRMGELEAFFRRVYAPFGALSDAQWRHLANTSMRRLPDGRVTPHYDPAIAGQLVHYPDDYLLWRDWDALRLPVLCLRGAHSDLVLPDVVAQMRQRGPGAMGLLCDVEVADCGHAPALNVPQQWALIADFLASARSADDTAAR